VIDANLSLATVDAQIAQHQANLAGFLVGAVVLGSARRWRSSGWWCTGRSRS
jgi:hypothetical protein